MLRILGTEREKPGIFARLSRFFPHIVYIWDHEVLRKIISICSQKAQLIFDF